MAFLVSTEKKCTTQKLRIMFYLADKTEDLSLGHSISDRSEGLVWRGQGGARIYEFLQQRPGGQNFKRLLLIKENPLSGVKEFSAFVCMGRCKSLGSLKSFLCYAPQLSGASILCFLILSSFRAHHRWRGPGGVMWWLEGCSSLCFLIWQAIFFSLILASLFMCLPYSPNFHLSCSPRQSLWLTSLIRSEVLHIQPAWTLRSGDQ